MLRRESVSACEGIASGLCIMIYLKKYGRRREDRAFQYGPAITLSLGAGLSGGGIHGNGNGYHSPSQGLVLFAKSMLISRHCKTRIFHSTLRDIMRAQLRTLCACQWVEILAFGLKIGSCQLYYMFRAFYCTKVLEHLLQGCSAWFACFFLIYWGIFL